MIRRTILAALAVASLSVLGADAQVNPQNFPANTVYGRLNIGPGPGQAIPISVLGASQFTASTVSVGSANAQSIPVISPIGYALANNPTVVFTAGFSNTGATTLNVASTGAINVLKKTPAGLVALATGDIIANQQYFVTYDGTQYELQTPSTIVNAQLAKMAANTYKCNNTAALALPTDCDPSGIDQNVVNSQTANYSIATTDCGKRIQAGTGSTGLFTVTLPSVSGFDAQCRVSVLNGDTGRGKKLSGFPTGAPAILYPIQEIDVAIVNGAWALVANPVRWRLSGAVTFNVDPVNGSDTNDGLATGSGNALATFQKCYDNIADYLDVVGQTVTCLSVASASYTNAGVTTQKAIVGAANTSSIVLDGNSSTLNMTNGTYAFSIGNNVTAETNLGARVKIQNFTLTGSASSGGIISNGGVIVVGPGMTFGAMAGGIHMISSGPGASILAINAYTISGGASVHAAAVSGASVFIGNSFTVTLTGTPNFTAAFVQSSYNGQLYADFVTWSGAATGVRFQAIIGSLINVVGCTGTFFPGNATGSTHNNSTYCGLNGTYTNDNANAGEVGEFQQQTVLSGAAISVTTSGTPQNLTAGIALSAGDWDVWCEVHFVFAASTSFTGLISNVSQTSATLDITPGNWATLELAANVPGAGLQTSVIAGPSRKSYSAPTNTFCVLDAVFTVSTLTAWGQLRARRVR